MADGGAQGTGAPVLARPKRAYGRSLADFQPLLPAEAKLLDCAARGKECDIARVRPDKAAPENTVRGAVPALSSFGRRRGRAHP